jgi:endonuclease/exonuclease/phosphatase family metal-dependent hydrolase
VRQIESGFMRLTAWPTSSRAPGGTVGGTPLEVVNLHLDTRLNPDERIQQLRPAVDLDLRRLVVAGDFNTNDLRWAFRTLPVAEARQCAAVDRLMSAKGFAAPTRGGGPTDNLPVIQLRLDSIFTRAHAVLASGVEKSVRASDHLPVWVDLAWPPRDR